MSTSPPPIVIEIDFADFLGIHSVAAAVIFTVLYVPPLLWFIRQSINIRTYVHYVLVLFCALRIAAFAIRAVLAASVKAGSNLGLVIADQVLISVGFFGLLYSAYTLVLNRRDLLPESKRTSSALTSILYNRRIFRLTLLIGVVLGVVAANKIRFGPDSGNDLALASTLRKASAAIFLVLTVLQACLTVKLVVDENAASSTSGVSAFASRGAEERGLATDVELRGQNRGLSSSSRSAAYADIGAQHGHWVLLIVSGLLLVREVYAVATVGTLEVHEDVWYPLTALPEFLAVVLYGTPGLVPRG